MRGLVLVLVGLLLPTAPAHAGCVGFQEPVEGSVIASFAPTGRYSGHWGIDIAAEEGTDVRPAEPGVVSFSGSVAGNQTVTIDHGGGLKTSYSYLSQRLVPRGVRVGTRTVIGQTGLSHRIASLHFSVRVGGIYQDPLIFLGCLQLIPADGLRLVS